MLYRSPNSEDVIFWSINLTPASFEFKWVLTCFVCWHGNMHMLIVHYRGLTCEAHMSGPPPLSPFGSKWGHAHLVVADTIGWGRGVKRKEWMRRGGRKSWGVSMVGRRQPREKEMNLTCGLHMKCRPCQHTVACHILYTLSQVEHVITCVLTHNGQHIRWACQKWSTYSIKKQVERLYPN